VKRDLDKFEYGSYSLGRSKLVLAFWVLFGQPILNFRFLPSLIRVIVLRLFGAKIGHSVVFKSNVEVLFPWRLSIGSNSWIGQYVLIINHEFVNIGQNVCVSQRSTLCSGGHDYKSISLAYKNIPIYIGDGAWICLDSILLGGSNIGEGSVVSAGEVVRGVIPEYSILIEGQITSIESPFRP